MKSVSVMVGDSVTLYTDDTETQGAQELVWKIQGENKFIAEIDKEINTLSVPGNDEEPFKGRLKLDGQTGSLTITNLKTTDSRVYELQIKTSRETKYKIFNVIVRDEAKTVSVKEGESVTLRTGLIEIKGYDRILWKFEDHLMGELNKATNQLSLYNNTDVRFKGRLQLNENTGSLTISNSKTTDSGVYHLNMSSSSHFLQRTMTVTVSDPGHYTSNEALKWGFGILVLVVVVVVVIVVLIYCCRKKSKPGQQNNVSGDQGNETDKPLHNEED
uniref:Coxsackievirus and adenovirus receptor homolog n=2 Tax=Sinocyclocheilus rhinocerous TaxID=307959 RepID=A0A673IYS7_9TELE